MRVLVMDSHSSLHIACREKKVSKRSVYMYPSVDFTFVIYDILTTYTICSDVQIRLLNPASSLNLTIFLMMIQ